MELANASGDKKTVQKLTANGMPPYYGKDVVWKSAVYLIFIELSKLCIDNSEVRFCKE